MQMHEGGYYIRLLAVDKPGTAATIATRLAEQEISLESIVQRHIGAAGRQGRQGCDRAGSGHSDHLCDNRRRGAPRARGGEGRPGDFGRAAIDPHRKKPIEDTAWELAAWPAAGEKGNEMASTITVAPNQVLERVLSLEIVRVTERAAVSAARLARSRQGQGFGSGGGRRHAARTQQAADRRHGGDRRGRDGRGADAVHRRAGRHQERLQGRYRGRSAGRHDAVREEHAGRDRDAGDGRCRHAAACAGLLHGQDRDRPGLSQGDHRSRCVAGREHHQSRQGQGREAFRYHRDPARPAAACRHHRRGPQDRRGSQPDFRRRRRRRDPLRRAEDRNRHLSRHRRRAGRRAGGGGPALHRRPDADVAS